MKKYKLLILDLDECLIHSVHKTQVSEMSFEFYKNSFDILGGIYRTMKRPHLEEFLNYTFNNFNIAVWTAAGADYTSDVLKNIGINEADLAFFYSEKNCTPKYDYEDDRGMSSVIYYKNISKLKKRGFDMEKVLIIDDKPEYIDSYGNVIKISPFYGDDSDTELLSMIKYLDLIKNEENYREIDKRNWNI
jgi:carboxy-terminal domain RNA polymerase II polypeptide A small phosphatase